MKLAPSKFQMVQRVVYRGTMLEASKQMCDRDLSVYISPIQKKLDAFLHFKTPTCKKDICGMAAQLKHWTSGLMLEFPALQKLYAHNVQFYWNQDLENELSAMKTAIKSHIKLSPFDTSKDVVTWTDAALTIGMAYILDQYKDPDNEALGVNILPLLKKVNNPTAPLMRNLRPSIGASPKKITTIDVFLVLLVQE